MPTTPNDVATMVIDSTGKVSFALDSLPVALAYDGSGNVLTATYGPDANGKVVRRTNVWAGTQLVSQSAFQLVATDLTLSALAAGGQPGVASKAFSVGVSPLGSIVDGTIVVTPSAGGGGGTFNPTSLSLTAANPTGTFTYTPGSAGAKVISITSNSALANPPALAYVAAGTYPGAPTVGALTPMSGAISVAFTPPTDTGGSAVGNFEVRLTTGEFATGAGSPIIVPTTSSRPVRAVVRAVNALGYGTPSAPSAYATPIQVTVPDIMAAPVLTAAANAVLVAFTAPSNGGSAILDYDYLDINGVHTTLTASGQLVSATAGALTTGTIRARNDKGYSAYSPQSNTVTPTSSSSLTFITRADIFGDSFSAGVGATTPTTGGWAYLYAAAKGIPIRNDAIAGTILQNRIDSTGSVRADNGLGRYQAALIGAGLSTDYAILYGFNDARYTGAPATINVANFTVDYRTMLTGMLAAGIPASSIRIGSPGYITDTGLATGSAGFTGQTRAGFEAYVTAVKNLATEFGVTYVPVYEYMRDNGGASLISADNIHPNDLGHTFIKNIFLNPALYVLPATAITRIDAFGSSSTVGTGATTPTTGGWAYLYAAAKGMTLKNDGIAGTVFQNRAMADGSPAANNGLSRYKAALIDNGISSEYVVFYGSNDARYIGAPATMNVTNYKADMRTMVDGMLAAGIPRSAIKLASNNYLTDTGLATGSTGYAGQTRAGLEAYVTAIKDLAAEYNIIYVPVYEYMRDNGGASLMAADNIHPNDAGHAVIKDIMLNPALYAGVAADTTAPIASSAAVANSTPTTLSVTFSEALNTSYVPDVSSVTVSGHTASALAVSGNTMIVTVNAYVSGEAASAVAYTQPATNGLRDAAGNLVASFSGLAVTNNVTGATVYPRFASPVGMTESGTGPYVYTGDGTAASGDGLVHGGMLNQSLQSGVDGSFSARMSTRPTGKSAYIGLNSVNAAAIATAIPYVVYASSSSNNYVAVANGVAQTVANTIAAAANDILRLRRTGTSIVGEVSKNAGSTWTTIYTWTSAPTTQLYYQMQLTGTVVADTLTSVGLA